MQGNVLLKGLIEHTPSEIENRVSVYLRQRRDIVGELPVDVELLLEHSANVRLETFVGLRAKHNVHGCVCNEFMSPALTVYVDAQLANGRDDALYSAVIGEELGHIELQRGVFHQIKCIDHFIEARHSPQWQRIEFEAVRFSLAVRIPVDTIPEEAEVAYAAVINDHGFGEGALLRMVNFLARRYVVPVEDMQRRLNQYPLSEVTECIQASLIARNDALLSVRQLDDIRPVIRQRMLYGPTFTQPR